MNYLILNVQTGVKTADVFAVLYTLEHHQFVDDTEIVVDHSTMRSKSRKYIQTDSKSLERYYK